MIRTKDDVESCYHDVGRRDCDCPHVNVKVRRTVSDVKFADDPDIPEGLTLEWIEAHLSDEQLDGLFWHVIEFEREWLEGEAEEVFGAGVEVQYGGRSGGWACVTGLTDIADWDAVDLAKWRRFARIAEQTARGIPEQLVYSIACNEYPAAIAADQEAAGVHRDPVALVVV
jgi:hypothetical protein